MRSITFVPERGDIVWLNFNPQKGHEQAGLRPALVLSPKSYNKKIGLMLACPITSKIKKYPFEVRVKVGKIDGAVLADQVKSLDWVERKVTLEAAAPANIVRETQELINLLLKN